MQYVLNPHLEKELYLILSQRNICFNVGMNNTFLKTINLLFKTATVAKPAFCLGPVQEHFWNTPRNTVPAIRV